MDTLERFLMKVGRWVDCWPWWLKVADFLAAIGLFGFYAHFSEKLPCWFVGNFDMLAAIVVITSSGILSLDVCWILFITLREEGEESW